MYNEKYKTIINKSGLKKKWLRKPWKENIFLKKGQVMYLNSYIIRYRRIKYSKKDIKNNIGQLESA